MGWTSEGLASDFNITREDMDAFAAASFQRAEHASDAGYFDTEIVPFEQVTKDSTSGQQPSTTIKQDEGLRRGTTIESLANVKPVFAQWSPGATTAGGLIY
jgi:acetyl-CoA acyltransferase 1